MRTSGADQDIALLFVPLAVLIGLGMFWLGGPRELLHLIDELVVDALSQVARLWT